MPIRKLLTLLFLSVIVIITSSGCKSCNKSQTPESSAVVDSTPAPGNPVNTINLPHADTSLIPILTKVLDEAFDASEKKDYPKLASLIMYRGLDEKRLGLDVFNARNSYELAITSITAQVFNKWSGGVDSRDYPRVFEMDQPDGQKMEVLEVIFVSKNRVNRKFFGFVKAKGDYKIIDVTSNL